ncbi:hypothetical protein VTL71DRAFT_4532 [Oculimacula yallundae]|uniref:Uncharacterized protein n=1 Tax=Oculimacula yallundae TaxID=86028 RepID=A0ABR4C2B9_9HELO
MQLPSKVASIYEVAFPTESIMCWYKIRHCYDCRRQISQSPAMSRPCDSDKYPNCGIMNYDTPYNAYDEQCSACVRKREKEAKDAARADKKQKVRFEDE